MRVLGRAMLALALCAGACAERPLEPTTTDVTTTRDPTTATTVPTAPVDLERTDLTETELLKVGECFDVTPSGTTEPRSCEEPHRFETFALTTHFEGEAVPYPGDAATNDFAFEACLAEFEDFVGTLWLRSGLDIFVISPTDESWTLNDRGIVCALVALSGEELHGSLKGSAGLRHEGIRGPEEFQVGDCFDDPEGPGSGVALKPCSEPHDSEVYAVVAYPSAAQAEFPGDEPLDAFAFDACLAEFDRYVGTPFEASSLDAFPLVPDPWTWLGGDRSVVCVLFDANLGELEGSMEGSRR